MSSDKRFNKVKGKSGEGKAKTYLESLGYEVIHSNWRCRLGELDLVARDGECLVFVEVKWRQPEQLGSPEASVDWRKQGQLIRLAKLYFAKEVGYETLARFDVIVIVGDKLTHYRNAFKVG